MWNVHIPTVQECCILYGKEQGGWACLKPKQYIELGMCASSSKMLLNDTRKQCLFDAPNNAEPS